MPDRKSGRAEELWPEDSVEVVASLTPDSPEARRVIHAPHHRRAGGFEPADLSPRLGKLMRRIGEHGRLGRAFSAALRESTDPTSQAIGSTSAEIASGMANVVRIKLDDPK